MDEPIEYGDEWIKQQRELGWPGWNWYNPKRRAWIDDEFVDEPPEDPEFPSDDPSGIYVP